MWSGTRWVMRQEDRKKTLQNSFEKMKLKKISSPGGQGGMPGLTSTKKSTWEGLGTKGIKKKIATPNKFKRKEFLGFRQNSLSMENLAWGD